MHQRVAKSATKNKVNRSIIVGRNNKEHSNAVMSRAPSTRRQTTNPRAVTAKRRNARYEQIKSQVKPDVSNSAVSVVTADNARKRDSVHRVKTATQGKSRNASVSV